MKEFRSCRQLETEPFRREDSTVQVTDVAPYRHSLSEVSEMRCGVLGPVVKDESRDTKLLWKREAPYLLREGRYTEILCVIGIESISGEADNFHILSDCLLDRHSLRSSLFSGLWRGFFESLFKWLLLEPSS